MQNCMKSYQIKILQTYHFWPNVAYLLVNSILKVTLHLQMLYVIQLEYQQVAPPT